MNLNRQLVGGLLTVLLLLTANFTTSMSLQAACDKECGWLEEESRGTRPDGLTCLPIFGPAEA